MNAVNTLPRSLAVLLSLALTGPATAGEPGSFFFDIAGEPEVSEAEYPVFDFDLQYRPRFEQAFNGDLRFREALGDTAISHRARFGTNVWYRNLRARVSVQNIRRFGNERLDPPVELFEAFVEVHGRDWGLRLGPQQITFSTGRLLVAPPWLQRSRTIDAARFVYDRGDFMADLIAGRHDEVFKRDIFAANFQLALGPVVAGVPLFIETNEFLDADERSGVTGDFARFTGGLTASLPGRLHADVEALYQVGDFEGDGAPFNADTEGGDISSYLLHADIGYRFDEILHPTLWVDYLSGDDDHSDDEYHTFSRILGYGRRLYGRADRFINIPLDTGNGGLLDLSLKNTAKVGPGALFVEYHYFLLPEDNLDGDGGQVGTEVDLRYSVRLYDKIGMTVASNWFIPLGDFRDERVDGTIVETDDVFNYHYVTLDLQLP